MNKNNLTKEMWQHLVEIATATGDVITAYDTYLSIMHKNSPGIRPMNPARFRGILSMYATHFGTPLPDGRKKKQEDV